MSDTAHDAGGTGPSHRAVEIGVCIAIAALAGIGIIGALRVGVGWGAEGPRAGFFPFYVSLAVILSSVINLVQIFRTVGDGAVFASWDQIRKVLAVVIPTAVYVGIIPSAGIYVSSVLLIAVFMFWLGKYRLTVALPIALVVPVLFFILFEKWFLVPLPKGPLEHLFGY
jgi:putative tricarboxylic transport membrane protein